MASSDNTLDLAPGEPARQGPAFRERAQRRASTTLGAWRSDGAAKWLFIWPTVLVILFLSLFPLIASVALSFSKLVFSGGGVELSWVGFALSLPLVVAVLFEPARRALDWLAALSRRLPFWTGVLFIALGLWSIWFALFVSLKP